MKGRVLKKLTACAAAAAMVLGMTVSVGATAIGQNGTATGVDGKTDTITIKKDVQVFNTTGDKIYSPKITFTYSVEPVTGLTDTTVTDGQGNKAVVRDGVDRVVTVNGGGVNFASGDSTFDATQDSTVGTNTSATDIKKITKDIELNVNIAGITAPGIYRYKIKDTTDANALEAAGILRPSDYNTVRYLDVYVVDDGSDGGVKIGGYVLFTATDGTVSIETTTVTTVVPGGEKTDGYVITSETEKETTDQTYLESKNKSDEYHTYNLKVTKDVTGDFGDRTHSFPFTVKTSGNTADYTFEDKDGGKAKKTIGNDIAESIKNGESFTLYGLPNNTTYTIEETNDTKDTYKVTITDESAVSASATAPTPTPAILKAEASVKTNEKATLENQKTEDASLENEYISVKYTNRLDSITPTGIFLRYAPYIIMAAAAIILIVVMRRRKTED